MFWILDIIEHQTQKGRFIGLTEDQLINAIKYSIAQIDKNKLYAIQLNWSSSETSRKSVEKALKENTFVGRQVFGIR